MKRSTSTTLNNHFGVVGRQPWNALHFDRILRSAPGKWVFLANEGELNHFVENAPPPRFLFFLHWSSKVPDSVLEKCECVCFHMTDVPYGRGGSPLQNLIVRGHSDTVLTALRMTSELDAGPVYMKKPLCLKGGSAEEIYQRASELSCHMALQIAAETPSPTPQTGEPTVFARRKPEQSRIPPSVDDLDTLFDHIRMLDAHGYPHAFLEYGNLRLEFTRAARYHEGLQADVRIKILNTENPA